MDNNEAWRNRNQNAMERNDAFEQVAKLEELRDQLTAICNKQTRRITELETQLAETERRKEGLRDCADYAAQCLKDIERELAESRERERKAIDLLNQIACRCNYELQDRSGQHVARVPGSRQWRDALYSIRLQIESQASAEPMPLVPFWECDKCGNVATIEREILCWKCGKGEMIYREASQASAQEP